MSVSMFRSFADAGGLMAYGPDLAVSFRRTATYADRILKGAKVADLPIEQPTQIELVINLKTAKALGLTIPPSRGPGNRVAICPEHRVWRCASCSTTILTRQGWPQIPTVRPAGREHEATGRYARW